MSIHNPRAWNREQLDSLQQLEEQIRRALNFVQIWDGSGDFPGLVPADGMPSAGVNVDWADITGKPSVFTPDTHTHAYADITGKPSVFTPDTHTHTISEITDYIGPGSMYTGYVPSTGTGATLPSGWSVSKTGTGVYRITHNLGLSSVYDLRFFAINQHTSEYMACEYQNLNANYFDIVIGRGSGVTADRNFFFFALDVS
jgi:hypothetical protein